MYACMYVWMYVCICLVVYLRECGCVGGACAVAPGPAVDVKMVRCEKH
jgi:hypothetical protein